MMTRDTARPGIVLLGLIACAACGPASEGPRETAPAPDEAPAATSSSAAGDTLRGRVLETIDTAGYTYVRVESPDGAAWAAAPTLDVAVGDEVIVPTSMPMQDVESRSLGRTFDLVYFADAIDVVGGSDAAAEGSVADPHAGLGDPTPEVDLSGIAKADGGLRVAEVHERAEELEGSEVVLRGRVVRATPQVMGRNWLHVRDGSGDAETNDLTVTTSDTAAVGDLVLVRGTLVTDQDFGYGYEYPVLVEEASVTVE